MSRNNVLEKYIIDLCSPTLASLKTASLINCYFINEKQLEKDMAELNLLLNGKGIKNVSVEQKSAWEWCGIFI